MRGVAKAMQAYLINLPDARARLEHMRQELGRIGMPFLRFDALDPERAARHPQFPRIQPLRQRPWAAGELACLLSHYEVWRLIAEGPDEFGMVLEDDLHVDPQLKKILDGDVPLPPDADVLKLETVLQNVALSRRAFRTPEGPAWHRLLSVHDGAGAYVISRRTAGQLVARVGHFAAPVDDLLFKGTLGTGRRLRIYQAVPALVIQSSILPAAGQPPELGSGLEPQRRGAWEGSHTTSSPSLSQRLRRRFREEYWRVFALRTVVPFGSRGERR